MRNEKDELIVCLVPRTYQDSKQALNELTKLQDIEELDIAIHKHKQKRSLDANAYFWVLCDKLAIELNKEYDNITKVEIYQNYIKNYSTPVPLPIKGDAVDAFSKNWEKGGIGWICEVVDDSKIPGYKLVHAYYGSSTFDTQEMTIIINAIVEDCKAMGIETRTPEQIQDLLNLWEQTR